MNTSLNYNIFQRTNKKKYKGLENMYVIAQTTTKGDLFSIGILLSFLAVRLVRSFYKFFCLQNYERRNVYERINKRRYTKKSR